MAGIVPQVITEVAEHLRLLAAAGADPRDWVAQAARPNLLDVADSLETTGDWPGDSIGVLEAQVNRLRDRRKKKSEEPGCEKDVERIDEELRRLYNWISDLNALNEPMTD